jgi:hypothetical protein
MVGMCSETLEQLENKSPRSDVVHWAGMVKTEKQERALKKKKLNSVVLVRKRTIPTKRPQPAGEVSANFS